jgi:branched-chain amino acid transport system substrate-binding protein
MTNKVGITLIAAAVALIGCGEQKPPAKAESKSADTAKAAPPAAGTEVRIGHVAPLTGGIAHLGKDNENGARLAIEEANAAKVQIGGQAVKFTLVAEDDQADPKVGATVAQKLVDAKVAGVVGHLNSGTSIPASPIYNQAGIPVISGSATNPKLTEQGYKQQFRVVGRDDQQGPAIASYLSTERKPKLVAVIDDATAYGEGIANEVEKTLKAQNIKVLPREKGTDKTTDWKAVLTKLRGRNPDAIFYGGMDATGGPLLKQGRELGIKAVFTFGDGACTDKMKELAGDAAEGLLCSQAGIPPQAASKKFLDAYK